MGRSVWGEVFWFGCSGMFRWIIRIWGRRSFVMIGMFFYLVWNGGRMVG